MFCHFIANLLVDVGTPIPMRMKVSECESSRGSGDHGVIFLGDGSQVSKE